VEIRNWKIKIFWELRRVIWIRGLRGYEKCGGVILLPDALEVSEFW
jgi:hypothetical protein